MKNMHLQEKVYGRLTILFSKKNSAPNHTPRFPTILEAEMVYDIDRGVR